MCSVLAVQLVILFTSLTSTGLTLSYLRTGLQQLQLEPVEVRLHRLAQQPRVVHTPPRLVRVRVRVGARVRVRVRTRVRVRSRVRVRVRVRVPRRASTSWNPASQPGSPSTSRW